MKYFKIIKVLRSIRQFDEPRELFAPRRREPHNRAGFRKVNPF